MFQMKEIILNSLVWSLRRLTDWVFTPFSSSFLYTLFFYDFESTWFKQHGWKRIWYRFLVVLTRAGMSLTLPLGIRVEIQAHNTSRRGSVGWRGRGRTFLCHSQTILEAATNVVCYLNSSLEVLCVGLRVTVEPTLGVKPWIVSWIVRRQGR